MPGEGFLLLDRDLNVDEGCRFSGHQACGIFVEYQLDGAIKGKPFGYFNRSADGQTLLIEKSQKGRGMLFDAYDDPFLAGIQFAEEYLLPHPVGS